MASKAKGLLRYDSADKLRFKSYFLRPPAKRGRPKKKRRPDRPAKKATKEKKQNMIVGNI